MKSAVNAHAHGREFATDGQEKATFGVKADRIDGLDESVHRVAMCAATRPRPNWLRPATSASRLARRSREASADGAGSSWARCPQFPIANVCDWSSGWTPAPQPAAAIAAAATKMRRDKPRAMGDSIQRLRWVCDNRPRFSTQVEHRVPEANPTLTALPRVRVGHWTHAAAGTGCTVVLFDRAVPAAVDVRGSAPGTRETDALDPGGLVAQADAILLTGGSAFGLAAADGGDAPPGGGPPRVSDSGRVPYRSCRPR